MRHRFNWLSIKIGMVFSRAGLSPNQWTMVTLIPTMAALYFLLTRHFLLSAGAFFAAAFIDLIDGAVARVMGRSTKLGAYLDTIMDRYVEGIIIFGLLFAGLPGLYIPAEVWLFIYFFGGMMTTYAKAAAKEKGLVQAELKGGILERAERLLILFAGIILAHYNTLYLTYVIVLLAILANVSALQRIAKAVKQGMDF
jgi:phosphatidylglycerophosphate synthase